MNKIDRDFLVNHGYKEVRSIKNVMQQGKIKDLHISIDNSCPAILVARVKEKTAYVVFEKINNKERLIITQTDRFGTYLFNIPMQMIHNALAKKENGITTIFFNTEKDNYTYRVCLS